MDRNEHITYWSVESDKDIVVMQSLFDNGHYTWSLFVGHLALEKMLKALYVKQVGIEVPRIHHLLKIARDCNLLLTPKHEDFLLEVTTYNLKGRYPDYKQAFSRKATPEFCVNRIEQIKEQQQWLKEQLAA